MIDYGIYFGYDDTLNGGNADQRRASANRRAEANDRANKRRRKWLGLRGNRDGNQRSDNDKRRDVVQSKDPDIDQKFADKCKDHRKDQLKIEHLPCEMLINILARLPVISIFRCRVLSKFFFKLLLSKEFANYHFSCAPTLPLLRNHYPFVYLAELDSSLLLPYRPPVVMKVTARFLLPSLPPENETIKRHFSILNSCNGLLCLDGYLLHNFVGHCLPTRDQDIVVICNPITGEYMTIPYPRDDAFEWQVYGCGMGVCKKTGHYKILVQKIPVAPQNDHVSHLPTCTSFIYTFATGLWRIINIEPQSVYGPNEAFVGGAFHWLFGLHQSYETNSIISFDFENEQFKTIQLPEEYKMFNSDDLFSIGVLKGFLCVCDASYWQSVSIWLMKVYGDQSSWLKELRIVCPPFSGKQLRLGLYTPIDYLQNGDLLMCHTNDEEEALVCHYRYLKFDELSGTFAVTPHMPSFLSLKEVLGDNIKALNANPRALYYYEQVSDTHRKNPFHLKEINPPLGLDEASSCRRKCLSPNQTT